MNFLIGILFIVLCPIIVPVAFLGLICQCISAIGGEVKAEYGRKGKK